MKIQKNSLPIAILALAVLVSSSMLSPVTVTTGQTTSTLIQTGDTFRMDSSRGSTWDSYEYREKYNFSNPSQTMEIVERNETETKIGAGWIDLFFARNVDPDLSRDTTLLVESYNELQPGSYRNTTEDRYDWGKGWEYFINDCPDVDNCAPENLAGRGEGRREQMSMTSNGTYAIIPPEMLEPTTRLPFWPRLETDFSQLDDTVWLQSRVLTTGTRAFTINGNPYPSVNVKTVNNHYARSDAYPIWVIDRDIGDDVNMSGSWDYTYSANMDFTYDNNGLLLEMVTNHDYLIDINLANSSFIAWGIQAGGHKQITIHWTQTETNTHYDYVGSRSFNTKMLVDIYNATSGLSFHVDDRGTTRSEQVSGGDFDINIYRHDSGHVWATNSQVGQVTGSHSEWENNFRVDELGVGQWFNMTCPTDPGCPDDGSIDMQEFKLDAWDSPSNSSYEIAPHIDDRRHIDMGDDDRDDGDDGDDGGFRLDFPREIDQTSFVVSTSLEDFTINGYPYVVKAEVRTASYKSEFTQDKVEVWLGDLPINATLTVTATATLRITFDSHTGVIMEHYESMEYDISVVFDGTVTFPGGGPPAGVIFDMIMDGYATQTITIKNHPRKFQEAQTEIPTLPTSTSTSETSTSETSSTSTKTSEPGETSSSSENTPDLPLPSPILPVIAGFFAIAFVYRKRN
ncbi:MAG: hypothetical protein ACXAB7_25165 [Candidatus Kariarchaeaceae archaeon]|jgi:hypothetical protein